MTFDWFTSDWKSFWHIALSAVLMLSITIAIIRLNGLRSLSKMSSFDFAVTVAIGSTVAGTVLSDSPSVIEGAIAVAALLACQRAVALARVNLGASTLVDNSPVVLMLGDKINPEALVDNRVTQEDVYAKLREANVTSLDQIHCVVLESTGDISVLHGEPPLCLDNRVMLGVQGYEIAPDDLGLRQPWLVPASTLQVA